MSGRRSGHRRVRADFRGGAQRDIDDELDFHIEMRTRRLVERGVPLATARDEALRRFGSVQRVRADCRAIARRRRAKARGSAIVAGLLEDVRVAARGYVKRPGFTAAALLTFALGVGTSSALLSVVDAVLLRPLPYAEPDRLVRLWARTSPPNSGFFAVSPANFLDWRTQNRVFEEMAAVASLGVRPVVTGVPEPERVQGNRVSSSFFGVLGVPPATGRAFTREDERPDAPPVVILSDELARRWFSHPGSALGGGVTLDGTVHTVVGVMPDGFEYTTPFNQPTSADLWLADAFRDDPPSERGIARLSAIARLKPGVSLEEARADMDAIAERLAAEYPGTNEGMGVIVRSLHGNLLDGVRPPLLLLVGAVGVVLLISCLNVANLLQARAVGRRRELALRAALGAGRLRLGRQLLTECAVLAFLGGIAGILMARFAVPVVVAAAPAGIPRLGHADVDARVVLWTVAVCALATLLSGALPAVQGSGTRLHEALRDGGSSAPSLGSQRGLAGLVVSQVALALVLLMGSGLLLNTLIRLHRIPLGFDPVPVARMQISLTRARYAEPLEAGVGGLSERLRVWGARPELTTFVEGLVERLEALPGVEAAAAVNYLPLVPGGGAVANLAAVEVPPDRAGMPVAPMPRVFYRTVTPDYFRALGIRLLHGRVFAPSDDEAAPAVGVVSEATASRYWPGEDPVGKRVWVSVGGSPEQRRVEVVGVVSDVRQYSFTWGEVDADTRLRFPPGDVIYVPYAQQPRSYVDAWLYHRLGVGIVVRARGGVASLTGPMRDIVRELDPDQPVASAWTMERYVRNLFSDRRFQLGLLSTLSAVAFGLAMVGVYGVMAYTVGQRTREIGIRMALGASRTGVLASSLRRGVVLSSLGIAVGAGGALVLSRLTAAYLSRFLYEVTPADPATLVAIAMVILAVSSLASFVPARRASLVEPVEALRVE